MNTPVQDNAEPPVIKKGAPTKLIFHYHPYNDYSGEITRKLTNLPVLHRNLGYDFKFEMPSVAVQKVTDEENYTSIFGKEKVKERSTICHFLCFSRELSEEELTFWRIFKLGWLSHMCRPPAVAEW